MNEGSTVVLYLLFGIPALFVGLYLLAMGPTGWFVAASLVVAIVATNSRIGDDEGGGGAVERTNCPECGAPNPVDAQPCGYGDASLPEP